MDDFRIIAIADIHYSHKTLEIPGRIGGFGVELLKRVLKRISYVMPDVIVIPGDILNEAEDMDTLLAEIKAAIKKTGIPVIVIPGNHDADHERFFSFLGKPSPCILKNFVIYPFVDSYEENDICTRKAEDLEKFVSTVKRYPDKKFIVLQHNPVYPLIESSYPYNLSNSEAVHQCYKENNVILSISGHYHEGQELTLKDGIHYLTVPALCESPFRYTEIEIRNGKVSAGTSQIKNPVPLCDNHCHTQFAYCAEDITIEKILERAELLNMGYVCFAEHADQLYLTREEYGKSLAFYNPDILKIARQEKRDRMTLFKEAVNKVRSEKVRIGLEVIPDKNGGISLLPEDREGMDVIIGAIHLFPQEILSTAAAKRERWFMDMVEILMKNKVNILAHPFRVFARNGLSVPESLFRPVVELLKSYNVAAELNFHTNTPEHSFFEICLAEGVKISPGTDTHRLIETGEFYPHLRFLSELGVTIDDLATVLYTLD